MGFCCLAAVFSGITAMTIRTWIKHEERPQVLGDKTKHLLACTDEHRPDFQGYLGHHIRESYLSPERMQEILEENGLARLVAQVRRKFPRKQETKIGEFGEIVSRVILEDIFRLQVPVIKIRYKTHRDIPVHGMDIVAFWFSDDDRDDVLYLIEVKTATSNSYCRSSQNKIRKKLSVLDVEQILDELNDILDWLPKQNDDGMPNHERNRVLAFYNRYEQDETGEIKLAPFLVQEQAYWSERNIAKLMEAAFDYPANIVVVKLRELRQLIDEVYHRGEL
jgi:hypothetical protein